LRDRRREVRGIENPTLEIVAIDGPAGAGKSTVGKILARRLGYLFLDTGAMYRAVAVEAERLGIRPDDEPALGELCQNLRISFEAEGEEQRVLCQGADVTEKIREPRIGMLASKVSMKKPVREALARLQRQAGERGKIVAEGRDTTTVVFPNARFKFFLVAEPEERARRRHRELLNKGLPARIEEIQEEINKRDEQDSSRDLAPLKSAEDAFFIDSTELTPEEVAEEMIKVIRKKSRK
jgi:CMP/dCMP kinase